MRALATLAALAIGLGACTAEPHEATVAPSDGASPTASGSPTPSAPDQTPSPSASATDPVVRATPGTGAPGSVAALDEVDPSSLGVALLAVDTASGAVSWWDGLSWQTFDVDAAFEARAWSTDGRGGLLVQDEGRNVWHVAPFSDEPMLVVDGPPDLNVVSHLVGGGVLDGRRYAFVEQGTLDSPETATSDIVAFDLDGRSDRTLLKETAWWESGTSEVHVIAKDVVMTVHAECLTGVIVRQIGGAKTGEHVAGGADCAGAVSTAGLTPFGEPAAFAVVESDQPDLPATLVRRNLGEFSETTVSSLPMHDNGWLRVSVGNGRAVVSSLGVVVAQGEGMGWQRVAITVPGVVVVADDLAVG